MSELLSKEVEAIISGVSERETSKTLVRSALRSVLLLAAKEMCQLCAYEIPLIDSTSYHGVLKCGKEQPISSTAAPIHKMIRGEK
jgi:hypothetical protein